MLRARYGIRDKVAVVTGGARGIGRATVEALLSEGCAVAILDLDGQTAQTTAHALHPQGQVRAWRVDVTKPEDFANAIEQVEAALGPVDILVNNAGIMRIGAMLDHAEATDLLQWEINVNGVLYGMRAVMPGMLARGEGHIVNIASVAGKVGTPFAAVYSGTKHAVIGITEAMRHEYKDRGLRFSYVCPALVDTELISGTGRPRFPPPARPEHVAQAIVRALRTGKVDLFVPRFGRVSTILPAILPRRVYEAIGRLFGLDKMFSQVDTAGREAYRARSSGSE